MEGLQRVAEEVLPEVLGVGEVHLDALGVVLVPPGG